MRFYGQLMLFLTAGLVSRGAPVGADGSAARTRPAGGRGHVSRLRWCARAHERTNLQLSARGASRSRATRAGGARHNADCANPQGAQPKAERRAHKANLICDRAHFAQSRVIAAARRPYRDDLSQASPAELRSLRRGALFRCRHAAVRVDDQGRPLRGEHLRRCLGGGRGGCRAHGRRRNSAGNQRLNHLPHHRRQTRGPDRLVSQQLTGSRSISFLRERRCMCTSPAATSGRAQASPSARSAASRAFALATDRRSRNPATAVCLNPLINARRRLRVDAVLPGDSSSAFERARCAAGAFASGWGRAARRGGEGEPREPRSRRHAVGSIARAVRARARFGSARNATPRSCTPPGLRGARSNRR